MTLEEAGVASISVQAEAVDETLADSLVMDRGTFTTTDGAEQEALDVWFHFNQFDAKFDAPVEIDPAILGLPNIRGVVRLPICILQWQKTQPFVDLLRK